MLTLRTYQTTVDFLAAAEAFLARDEPANNVIYGLARRMADDPTRAPEGLYLATVHRQDEGHNELLYAAEMTPPWRLLISTTVAPLEDEDFTPLIKSLRTGSRQTSGVTAPAPIAEQFARNWAAHTGDTYAVEINMRLFELRKVVWPQLPGGKLRVAGRDDLPLVFQWFCEFSREAMPTDPMPSEDGVLRSIEGGGVFLWEDGAPVSLVVRGRILPHGASVGPVYTPKEQRGLGYASAAVAALSQAILDSGADFCVLFTDLANPTSNHIYQEVGYRPLCDFVEYNFYAAQEL